MTAFMNCVVEGRSEVGCVTALLHRVWTESAAAPPGSLRTPFAPDRRPRDLIVTRGGRPHGTLGDFMTGVVGRLRQRSGGRPTLALLLLDSEGDDPLAIERTLRPVVSRTGHSNVEADCVVVHPMFETWVVAGAAGLAGVHGLPADLPRPAAPEAALLGKGWLLTQLRRVDPTRAYNEVRDLPAFVRRMALADCEAKSLSFARLVTILRNLAARLAPAAPPPPP